jgi:hypothetical protein
MKYRFLPLLLAIGCGGNMNVKDNRTPQYEAIGYTVTRDSSNWDKVTNYNDGIDRIKGMAIDGQGNLFVTGTSQSVANGSSKHDAWIKKYNKSGTEITTGWDKLIDGGDNDVPKGLVIDKDDNVYILLGSKHVVTASTSNNDIWIKKYDKNGVEDTTNWDKKIDHNNENNTPTTITLDSKGNVYIGVNSLALVDSGTTMDWWIMKFTPDGNHDATWAAPHADTTAPLVPGKVFSGRDALSGWDQVQALGVDSQDRLYAMGEGELLANTPGQSWNGWIMRFNSDGTIDSSWAGADEDTYSEIVPGKVFQDDFRRVSGIAFDSKDNVYLVGMAHDGVTHEHVAMKKFDKDGVEDTDWDYRWECGSNSTYCKAHRVVVDQWDYVYMGGFSDVHYAGEGTSPFVKVFDRDGTEDTTQWGTPLNSTGVTVDLGSELIHNNDDSLFWGANMREIVSGSSDKDCELIRFNIDYKLRRTNP